MKNTDVAKKVWGIALLVTVMALLFTLGAFAETMISVPSADIADADLIFYQATKAEDGSFSLRLASGVNTLDYKSYGFDVVITTKDESGSLVKQTRSGKGVQVYSSIYGGETEYSIAELSGAQYGCLATVTGLDAASEYVRLDVFPYVISKDSQKTFGASGAFLYTGETDAEGYPLLTHEMPANQDAGVFTKMQSVLLLGQSNMSGRGWAEAVEPISDDRIFMQRDGEWVKMEEPIHYESDAAEIGLAASFAKAFVETFDCELGLIPAAVGGSGISRWKKSYTGEDGLYATAIERAKAAQETSEICAILWHQGETNRNSTTYDKHLKEVLDAMIEDLGLDKDKIVIITGELGAWTNESTGEPYQVDLVNGALARLDESGYYPNFAVASQEGLTNIERNQGSNHFDSPSLRVFGYRYFECFYEELTGKECTYAYSQDPDDYRIDPTA